MGSLTWIGDTDPAAQSVTVGGVTFVRGQAVPVKDKATFEALSKNPMFSADGKFDEPDVDEPTDEQIAARSEEGTQKAALKAQLRDLGEDVKGNPSLDTLRNRLATAHAK